MWIETSSINAPGSKPFDGAGKTWTAQRVLLEGVNGPAPPTLYLSMILSENRFPLFGIKL